MRFVDRVCPVGADVIEKRWSGGATEPNSLAICPSIATQRRYNTQLSSSHASDVVHASTLANA